MAKTKVWKIEFPLEDGVVCGTGSKARAKRYMLAADHDGQLRIVYRGFSGDFFSSNDPLRGYHDDSLVEIVG